MPEADALTGKRQRFGFIDLAKGLMLIKIIITHTQGYFITYPIDNFSLVVFFICAGFTSRPDFSLRRIFGKLLVPYVIMNLICVAYVAIVAPANISLQSLAGILYSRNSVLPLSAGADRIPMLSLCNSVLWFTTALMSAYCVFRLITIPSGRKAQALACLLSLALAALCTRLPVLLPWSVDTAFFLAPFMWAGRQMRAEGVLDRMSWKGFALLSAIYAATYFPAGHTNYSVREYGDSFLIGAVCALSGAVAFIWLCVRLDRLRPLRAVKLMNSQAMYVFGLQLVFIDATGSLSRHFGLPEVVEVLTGIALACVGGYFAGRVINAGIRLCK
ncbi:MAG: acyltransferase family protein [Muribaculaceae bacterium]|nr:acyltransferase family protein [Muribaculaceae bacterium]